MGDESCTITTIFHLNAETGRKRRKEFNNRFDQKFWQGGLVRVPLVFQRFPRRIIFDTSFLAPKIGTNSWVSFNASLISMSLWWNITASIISSKTAMERFRQNPMILQKMTNSNMLSQESVRNIWKFRSIREIRRDSGILTVPKPRKGGAIVVNIRKRVLKLAKSKAQSKIRRIANFFLWNSTHCHARDASNYFRDPFISLPQTRFRFFRLFMTDVRILRTGTFFWEEFS